MTCSRRLCGLGRAHARTQGLMSYSGGGGGDGGCAAQKRAHSLTLYALLALPSGKWAPERHLSALISLRPSDARERKWAVRDAATQYSRRARARAHASRLALQDAREIDQVSEALPRRVHLVTSCGGEIARIIIIIIIIVAATSRAAVYHESR